MNAPFEGKIVVEVRRLTNEEVDRRLGDQGEQMPPHGERSAFEDLNDHEEQPVQNQMLGPGQKMLPYKRAKLQQEIKPQAAANKLSKFYEVEFHQALTDSVRRDQDFI
jgi:hypothetical protein